MARVATVRWRTPRPTSIDEDLAVFDDGTAWLLVRHAGRDPASVGTFRTDLSDDERSVLEGAAPVLTIDPLELQSTTGVAATAATVAERARATPHAGARFHARVAAGAAGGAVTVGLAVVGEGDHTVAFELDPSTTVVHFLAGPETLSWVEAPPPPTGFVTAEADGLGGLNGRASVQPGQLGVLTLAVAAPAGCDGMAVQLEGWLVEAVPDAAEPVRFAARTALARFA